MRLHPYEKNDILATIQEFISKDKSAEYCYCVTQSYIETTDIPYFSYREFVKEIDRSVKILSQDSMDETYFSSLGEAVKACPRYNDETSHEKGRRLFYQYDISVVRLDEGEPTHDQECLFISSFHPTKNY